MSLTDRSHWDHVHRRAPSDPPADLSRGQGFRLLRCLLGDRVDDYAASYSEYILWNHLYRRYIPEWKGRSVFEVGCAPGHHLVRMHRELGAEPYGVDYSPEGVELCRRVFREHGLDPARVLQADFFSDEFLAAHAGKYDLVFSHGFIEHFEDVRGVIQRHARLVRPGGHLIVAIPNIRGVNYLLTALFHRRLLKVHNLEIMNLRAFRRLFDQRGLTPLYGNYYGTFNFGIFYTPEGSRLQPWLAMAERIQLRLNILLRALVGARGVDGRYWSPYLIYIGQRSPSEEPAHEDT